MKYKRSLSSVAFIGAAVFALAACSSTDNSQPSDNGSTPNTVSADSAVAPYLQPPTELSVTTALSESPTSGLSVAFLSPGRALDAPVGEGMSAAAEVLGWSVKSFSYDLANPASVSSVGLSALDAGFDALVYNATDAALYAPVVEAAKAKGVPVLDLLTSNEDEEGVTKVLASDFVLKGEAEILGEAILEDAAANGEAAHVVQLTVPTLASILGANRDGLEPVIAECDECTYDLVDVSIGELVGGQIPSLVVSYLQSHPDVNYVFFDAGSMSEGTANAIRAAGLPEPAIFANSATDKNLQELREGARGMVTGMSNEVVGWIAIDTIARATAGDDADVWRDVFPPFMVFTADNVGDTQTIPQMPDGYEDMFAEMWLVN